MFFWMICAVVVVDNVLFLLGLCIPSSYKTHNEYETASIVELEYLY